MPGASRFGQGKPTEGTRDPPAGRPERPVSCKGVLTILESLRLKTRRLVDHRLFGGLVFVLILVSVTLLAWELSSPEGSPIHRLLGELQAAITLFFVVELTLRWIAAPSSAGFFRNYWIDILAVLPLLRVFRLGRAFRLVRLLRLLRLPNLMDQHLRVLRFLFRRRAAEYLLYLFLISFAVVAGTLALATFEHRPGDAASLTQAFWSALFTLFAGEYITELPASLGGKVAALMIMFSGLGFFAVITGTVSAIMIEKLKEGTVLKPKELSELEDHVLICGWNSGVETMLKEFQNSRDFREKDIVVICSRKELPEIQNLGRPDLIHHLHDDFTRSEVLKQANVHKALAAVIVSDQSDGRSRQDADARTVLAALTIEKLNPKVHTCAELSNAMNEDHLRMGKVDQVILTRDLAGHMLAQAAMHTGAVSVIKDLLRSSVGSRLESLPVEGDLVGRRFEEAIGVVLGERGWLPVALERPETRPADLPKTVPEMEPRLKMRLNPRGVTLQDGDKLICVSGEENRPEAKPQRWF